MGDNDAHELQPIRDDHSATRDTYAYADSDAIRDSGADADRDSDRRAAADSDA